MCAETTDARELWMADQSHQIRAVRDDLSEVRTTTAKTQDLVLPLGQLLDLLGRPEDQAQELGASLATALNQIASSLGNIEAQQELLEVSLAKMQATTSVTEECLRRMEKTMQGTSLMIKEMSHLLLAEDTPLPSA